MGFICHKRDKGGAFGAVSSNFEGKHSGRAIQWVRLSDGRLSNGRLIDGRRTGFGATCIISSTVTPFERTDHNNVTARENDTSADGNEAGGKISRRKGS